jgi:hypothetical protein
MTTRDTCYEQTLYPQIEQGLSSRHPRRRPLVHHGAVPPAPRSSNGVLDAERPWSNGAMPAVMPGVQEASVGADPSSIARRTDRTETTHRRCRCGAARKGMLPGVPFAMRPGSLIRSGKGRKGLGRCRACRGLPNRLDGRVRMAARTPSCRACRRCSDGPPCGSCSAGRSERDPACREGHSAHTPREELPSDR